MIPVCEEEVPVGLRYLSKFATLELDEEKCTGCGLCLEVCPHGVFSLGAGHSSIQDRDACMECGGCALNCPSGALRVRAGVGCAYAIFLGRLRGTEPCCG
jgi:NAD-dependent dihydropyrimidine dehydrogenase PreA subunit